MKTLYRRGRGVSGHPLVENTRIDAKRRLFTAFSKPVPCRKTEQ